MLSITCSGFGGQGVLTQGLILANVSMEAGKQLTWVPSYGSEMRGGTASCHLRIADTAISNPFFKKINVLIAMNEGAIEKFENMVEKDGILIVNSSMVKNHTFRKDICVIEVPATELSMQMKNPRGANIMMLGAAIAASKLSDVEEFANGIDSYFAKKGKVNPLNRECFMAGAKAAQ